LLGLAGGPRAPLRSNWGTVKRGHAQMLASSMPE